MSRFSCRTGSGLTLITWSQSPRVHQIKIDKKLGTPLELGLLNIELNKLNLLKTCALPLVKFAELYESFCYMLLFLTNYLLLILLMTIIPKIHILHVPDIPSMISQTF